VGERNRGATNLGVKQSTISISRPTQRKCSAIEP
jgi:hypothetical protein